MESAQHLNLSVLPEFPRVKNHCFYSNKANKVRGGDCVRKSFAVKWKCVIIERCAGTNKALSQLVDLADVCYVRCCFIERACAQLKVILSKAVASPANSQQMWFISVQQACAALVPSLFLRAIKACTADNRYVTMSSIR